MNQCQYRLPSSQEILILHSKHSAGRQLSSIRGIKARKREKKITYNFHSFVHSLNHNQWLQLKLALSNLGHTAATPHCPKSTMEAPPFSLGHIKICQSLELSFIKTSPIFSGWYTLHLTLTAYAARPLDWLGWQPLKKLIVAVWSQRTAVHLAGQPLTGLTGLVFSSAGQRPSLPDQWPPQSQHTNIYQEEQPACQLTSGWIKMHPAHQTLQIYQLYG